MHLEGSRTIMKTIFIMIAMMIGSWLWMSGAPWSYANWNQGEPNQNGNEDCGAFDSQAPDNSYKVS